MKEYQRTSQYTCLFLLQGDDLIKTTCKYCGIVQKPHRCPYSNGIINQKEKERSDKKIYRTGRWNDVRNIIMKKYNHMCLWNLYVNGKIVEANTVHHIVEVLSDDSLAYDESNLIPLGYYAHIYIHELYKVNKQKVQKLLYTMLNDYNNGVIVLEKYKVEANNMPPYV